MNIIKNQYLKNFGICLVSLVLSVSTLALGVLTPIKVAANTPTTVMTLGDLGGGFSRGNAINEQGHVAGYSKTAAGNLNAFIWNQTTGMQNLGAFNSGVYLAENLNLSIAEGLNDNGQVVGHSISTVFAERPGNPSGYFRHAFVWSQATGMVDIGVPSGGYNSFAVNINNNGQVAGYSDRGDGYNVGWLWENGTFTTSPCVPNDINSSGTLTGSIRDELGTGDTSACTWDKVNGLQNLGHMGGGSAEAKAINNLGQIVGHVSNPGHTSVFIWDPITGLRDMTSFDQSLGFAGTEGNDINDSMQVTGRFRSTDICSPVHVYVWDPTNGVTDIGTDGYATVGDSINNNGQVSGYNQIGRDVNTDDPCISPPATSSPSILMSSATLSSTSTATDDIATLWSGNKPTVRKISVAGGSIVRGDSGISRTIQFPITLSVPSTTNVTVNYTITADGTGTALPTTDFVAKTGRVIFKVGANGYTRTTLWVSTTVKPSTTGGTKTFKVSLSNPVGTYSLNENGANAVGTILQRSGSSIRASVGDTNVWEGDHGKNAVRVWVNLSAPATTTVSLKLNLVNGSALGGQNYKTFAAKNVVFLAGQFQKSFVIYTNTNMFTETNKDFSVVLSNPSVGLTIDRSTALVNILNDD